MNQDKRTWRLVVVLLTHTYNCGRTWFCNYGGNYLASQLQLSGSAAPRWTQTEPVGVSRERASHVQRLCPHCSGPGVECQPGAHCCVPVDMVSHVFTSLQGYKVNLLTKWCPSPLWHIYFRKTECWWGIHVLWEYPGRQKQPTTNSFFYYY